MTALAPAAGLAAPRRGTAARWNRVKAGAHRRAGRVEWIVLVLVILFPQLVIALLFAD
ncbi:hypothetical protein [Virgisporangium aurantiacum]|uniref:Uncharacterized protein n=1 Tax=Virgisporangium aurantiacum TaxID=175570 RepID=A0A8J4DZS7_9ACTN|nr:hypothetical protein [Virgisporangium aurantiacum]GIJ57040.1 hypothetical protein Vau01_045560 [Virgisporangium aurantiacum]